MRKTRIQNKPELIEKLCLTQTDDEVLRLAEAYSAAFSYCRKLKSEALSQRKADNVVPIGTEPIKKSRKNLPSLEVRFEDHEEELMLWLIKESVEEVRSPAAHIKWILKQVKKNPDIIL